ncbi:ureidoglycolate lyase [Scandinavium manionii]|uniref:ureidoglycolate lyase n=1 Tax=Scandinavium manionii TaxID=2926520 RepID=UPI001358385A|nr:ureidoglycolate lyase [Scandinavium manionii]MCS2150750.1 ureidoglycolate lyase [Scandinavium manionii]MCS2166971.1 ureidoglycolate lyase [Scandinavium manionii]
MKLEVKPLSRAAFAEYGDVIETEGQDFFFINNGQVQRFHDLAHVEILEQDRTLISINQAQPVALPIIVTELERHPLGTQAFVPLHGEPFVIVVALGGDDVDLTTLRAFITNGQQGVNYHRNVWHHPLFAWQKETQFLTIDRGGNDNCDVVSVPSHELVIC